VICMCCLGGNYRVSHNTLATSFLLNLYAFLTPREHFYDFFSMTQFRLASEMSKI
jgi:hypothetical protein